MINPPHTPGPWRLGEVRETRQTYNMPADKLLELMAQEQVRIYGRGRTPVASCAMQRGQEEAEANAKLLAKAPEMAQALLYSVRLLKFYGAADQNDNKEMREVAKKAARILKAAGVDHE